MMLKFVKHYARKDFKFGKRANEQTIYILTQHNVTNLNFNCMVTTKWIGWKVQIGWAL